MSSKAFFVGGPWDGQEAVTGETGVMDEILMPHGKTHSVYRRYPSDKFKLVYAGERMNSNWKEAKP